MDNDSDTLKNIQNAKTIKEVRALQQHGTKSTSPNFVACENKIGELRHSQSVKITKVGIFLALICAVTGTLSYCSGHPSESKDQGSPLASQSKEQVLPTVENTGTGK